MTARVGVTASFCFGSQWLAGAGAFVAVRTDVAAFVAVAAAEWTVCATVAVAADDAEAALSTAFVTLAAALPTGAGFAGVFGTLEVAGVAAWAVLETVEVTGAVAALVAGAGVLGTEGSASPRALPA